MTPAWTGALLGLLAGLGLWLAVARARAILRPSLTARIVPYLRDLPGAPAAPASASAGVADVGPMARLLQRAAATVDEVLGGATSVQRRLDRAGLRMSVQELRVQQVQWGLVALGLAAAWTILQPPRGPAQVVPSVLVLAAALAGGLLARDWWLTQQATARERRVLAEFPTIAELLALAVAAGESPVGALERATRRGSGAMAEDLRQVLAEIRTGRPVAAAFDRYASRTGLPTVARFAQALAVVVERGTPLAEVLHAQAADVREAGRRELIESAARKEVLMMIPVVFLVLPTVVVFAFYPGLVGLRLTAT